MIKALGLAFGLVACGEARANPVILSCSGTVTLIQPGEWTKEKDEKFISITIDIAERTLTIDGQPWSIYGNTADLDRLLAFPSEVSAMHGTDSARLNRITGTVEVNTLEDGGDGS